MSVSIARNGIKMAANVTISHWNNAHNVPHYNVFNNFVAKNELPAAESTFTRLLKGLNQSAIDLIKDVVANSHTEKYYSSSREWIALPGPPRRVTPLLESAALELGIEVVEPNSEVPWHQHADTDELFLFLDGEAEVFVSDHSAAQLDASADRLNTSTILGAQQSCWVPLGCRHRLVNRSSSAPLRFIYLFSPSPVGGFVAQLRDRK